MEQTPINQKRSKLSRLKPSGRGLVALIVVALAVAVAVLFYQNAQSQDKLKKLENNPQEVSKTEAEQLAKKVGETFDLPKDETPSVATVVDASKLKSQPFFAKAENGDKVLIYSKARKAYLYRTSTDKLIEVATLQAPSPKPTPAK